MVRLPPLALLTAALAAVVSGTPANYSDAVLDLQKKGRVQLDAALAHYESTSTTTCTRDKLQIRREYGDLSAAERKAYIAAMLCLMDRPPKLTQYAGVTNRYEDFVAVHINQTLSIHGTGNFLSWHRY